MKNIRKRLLVWGAVILTIGVGLGTFVNTSTQLCYDNSTTIGVPESQCVALVELYEATDGENWNDNTNWLNFEVPVGMWHGVTVEDASVVKILLNYNNLTGSIPETIEDLTDLQYLYLRSNDLSGSIPETIGNLANLIVLSLELNELSGPIPETIGNLANLIVLSLESNELSGLIPESIGDLTDLQELKLFGNDLTGSIPDTIGNLSNLQSLYLYNNKLSGTIPESLGGLDNLQKVFLLRNKINGDLSMQMIPNYSGELDQFYAVNANCMNELSSDISSALQLQPNLDFYFNIQGSEDYCNNFSGNTLPDLTGDGIVCTNDLLVFLGMYGSLNPLGDFDGDGKVAVFDLLYMFNNLYSAPCGEGPEMTELPPIIEKTVKSPVFSPKGNLLDPKISKILKTNISRKNIEQIIKMEKKLRQEQIEKDVQEHMNLRKSEVRSPVKKTASKKTSTVK